MARSSLDSLDTRVTALEGRMEVFEFDQRRLRTELQENTKLTEDIHGNTSGLVEFVRDVKHHSRCVVQRSARIGKWLTATCGGAAALVTLAHVMGWW